MLVCSASNKNGGGGVLGMRQGCGGHNIDTVHPFTFEIC